MGDNHLKVLRGSSLLNLKVRSFDLFGLPYEFLLILFDFLIWVFRFLLDCFKLLIFL